MIGSLGSYIKHALAASAVAAVLVVLGCGTAATATSGAATPVPGATVAPAPKVTETTLRVGLPFLSNPPDPVKGGQGSSQNGLAETLFKLGRDFKPEPWLATGARSLNEKTWEITLRQGVKFHNGALMDAASVKASLERAITKSPAVKALLDIALIEVKDPFTLTVTTNNPSPILPAQLTEPNSAIVDAAAAEAMGDAFTERPVLTGPFKVERFQLDKELVVVRHKEYWGQSPSVDRVIFSYLPDNSSRVLALQSGDIDISADVAPESVTTVQNASNLLVRPAKPISLEFMYLNHRREPWKDVRVRQALAFAIDREALVKAVMQSQGTAAIGLFPPAMLTCNEIQGYPFDPGKAKRLLAEAGYQDKDGDGFVEKDGRTLAMSLLTYRQRPELPPMAEAIQGSLRIIGVKVDVRPAEQIDAALRQGDWDGGMYFFTTAFTGEPYRALSQIFTTGGSANFGGYSSPRVDELTSRLGVAAERQTREQLACAASKAIIDELAVVPLLYPNYNYGVSRRVIGFDEPNFWFYLMDSKKGKQ